jgi:murein DD-endopeptidase MepM/ murein hydrolase activator NlpD
MKGTYDLVRGQLAGGGDFAKADEQLRSKLAGYGITETGQAMIKGSRQFGKLSASQEKIYKEIQGKRSDLQKLKEERDAKIREIELDEKYYTQKSPRSARVLSSEGARKIQEIRQSYNQKALKLFGTETPTVQPKTPAVSDYKSPFAGARDREALKASKITGNAPISIGERAGFSKSRGRVHAGRDIAAPSGTGLQVPSDSVITDKGFDSGYGNYVVFKDSNGIEHLYGHMLEASPYNEGDRVSAGTVIGRVGSTGRSTGPHLHWEVSRVMGEVGRPRSNVIDPLELGFPAQAPFTGKVDAAKIAPSTPSVPSIPSPTGGNIAMLPLPLGLGKQEQTTSNSGPLQTPVPYFSSEDPNNMTTLVVKAIYNVVG